MEKNIFMHIEGSNMTDVYNMYPIYFADKTA